MSQRNKQQFSKENSEEILIEDSYAGLEAEINKQFKGKDEDIKIEECSIKNDNKPKERKIEDDIDFFDSHEFLLDSALSVAHLKEGGIPFGRSPSSCQFCEWQLGGIQFLRKNMHLRYFDAFNFYFAKPINEILANYQLPHVISLKDYQYLDEDNEYLKRYYAVEEVPPRLTVLTQYFANSYHQTRPNLIVTSLHKIIEKRDIKQARIFVMKLKKQGRGPQRAFPRLFNRNDDSSESGGFSDTSSEEKQSEQQPGFKDQGIRKKKKIEVPSKVLFSHLSQTIAMSQMKSQQCEQSGNYNNLSAEYENYRNFILQMSFESSAHDIYNPTFSRSINNQINISELKSQLSTSQKPKKQSDPILTQLNLKEHDQLIDLVVTNGSPGTFDHIVEQMSLKGQQQRYIELIDSVAAVKQTTPGSIHSALSAFNPQTYIMGDLNNSSSQESLEAQPTLSQEAGEKFKLASGSKFFSSYSELNNPQINKSASSIPVNNISANNKSNSNNSQSITNKSGANAYKILQDNNNNNNNNTSKGINIRSSLGTIENIKNNNYNNTNSNTSRSNSESKTKNSKSIQQVQQYILSQIKKQNEILNPNQSSDAYTPTQQPHLRTSMSPASPLSGTLQNNNSKQQQGKKQQSPGKKLGTEKNYTETNLGSVFEKLRLSIRMASQESKQTVYTEPNLQTQNQNNDYININQFNQNNSNNYEGYLQKISHESLPKRGDSANKKSKQVNQQNPQSVGSLNVTPLAYTPRDFTKKSVTRLLLANESAPHLHIEQSPQKLGNIQRKESNIIAENKKTSNSNKRQLVPQKSKELGHHNSQDGSISPTHLSSKISTIPKSHHSISTIPQIPYLTQGSMSMQSGISEISQIGNNNNNSMLSLNQKITSLSQKQTLSQGSSQGKIKTQENLDFKQNTFNLDRDFKSARVKTSVSPPPQSKVKKGVKRGSQERIISPPTNGSQSSRVNLIPNSYFQHSGQLHMQQQQQSSNMSSSIHLLQQTAGHLQMNDTSQQSLGMNSLQPTILTPSQKQLQQFQSQSVQSQSSNKVDKQLTERILTNALTNTINKFYKNIIRKTGAHDSSSSKYNPYQHPIPPHSQSITGLPISDMKLISSDNDSSPLLKLGVRRSTVVPKSNESLPLRGTHSQKESIGSTSSAFSQDLVEQIQSKPNNQMTYAGLQPSHAPLSKKKPQQMKAHQKGNNSKGNETGGSLLGIVSNQSINNSMSNTVNPPYSSGNLNTNCNNNFQGNSGGSNNLNNNINININNNFNAATITTNHTTFNYNNDNEFLPNQLPHPYIQPSATDPSFGSSFSNSKSNFYNSIKQQPLQSQSRQLSTIPIVPPKIQQPPQSLQVSQKQISTGSLPLQNNNNNSSSSHNYSLQQHARTESQKSIGTPRQTIKPQQKLISSTNLQQQQQQPALTYSKLLIRNQQNIQKDIRMVKTESSEDSQQIPNSTVQQIKNLPNSHGKNGSLHSINQYNNYVQPNLNQQNSSQYVLTQPNHQTNYSVPSEILPQSADFKQNLLEFFKKKGSANNITPLKNNDANKNRVQKKKEKPIQSGIPLFSMLPSNLQANDKRQQQDECQLGSGFLSQRDLSNNRKKSSELYNGQPQQKFIQSSRGSYQGQYSDLTAPKHGSLNQLSQPTIQQKPSSSPIRQQQTQPMQFIQGNYISNYQQQQQSNQIPIQLQYVHQLQQSQSQTHLVPTQQSANNSGFFASGSQGSLTNTMSQQQVAGLNHKIKQLSQKILQ